MTFTRTQLAVTAEIADLLAERDDAERRGDDLARQALDDDVAFCRAELRRPGSGAFTEAMRRYYAVGPRARRTRP